MLSGADDRAGEASRVLSTAAAEDDASEPELPSARESGGGAHGYNTVAMRFIAGPWCSIADGFVLRQAERSAASGPDDAQ